MKYINFEISDELFKVTIDGSLIDIINVNELPLKFRVEDWLTGDILYEFDMNPGWWSTYNNTSFKNFCVYTKSGKILKKKSFDPHNEVSKIEEAFNIWVTSNTRSNGLVLGAGTGRWGEWLLNTTNNDCRVVLVEGDPNNQELLYQAHKNRPNVSIEKCVVSTDGGLVKFWVAPQNMVSSLDKSVVEKFWPNIEPEFVEVESKSINQIIQTHFEKELDWIRIDLEGLDHQILMSLDLELVPNLKMVIYENMNISNEEIEEINTKLSKLGFGKFINIGIDTMCLK